MSSPADSLASDVFRIVQHFGIIAESAARIGGGFSDAAVFRVIADDQRSYAVRCTPCTSSQPNRRLRALHQLLLRMQDGGLRTIAVPLRHPFVGRIWQPQPPDNMEAEWVSETILQWHGNQWQVEPWLPGEAISSSPQPTQRRSALLELAEFHRCAAEQVPRESPSDWFFVANKLSPGVERRRDIARELSSGLVAEFRRRFANETDSDFRDLAMRVCRVLERWLPWLTTRLETMAEQPFLLQPVIRDLWSAHVLFTDSQVSGLIDLTAMSTDHVCFDVSRLFRSWYGANLEALRDAVAEFAGIRPLNSSELTLLQTVDAATVLLSPVTWLRRRMSENGSSPMETRVTARLAQLTGVAEQFEPL